MKINPFKMSLIRLAVLLQTPEYLSAWYSEPIFGSGSAKPELALRHYPDFGDRYYKRRPTDEPRS